MVTAAYDTSNLVALYKDGLQCETCCTPPGGWASDDCLCFIDGSGSPCGQNPDFDEWPPFGGPGKTPGVYTITIDGYSTCPTPKNSPAPDLNGVWGLPYLAHANDCQWFLSTSIGGITVTFQLLLCRTGGGVFGLSIQAPGETLFRHDLNANPCDIVMDNAANFFAGCGNPGDHSGFGGIVSWRPGTIPAWDSGTGYVIGDMVAHEGVFYQCTADNTNQEPPNVAYWVVI